MLHSRTQEQGIEGVTKCLYIFLSLIVPVVAIYFFKIILIHLTLLKISKLHRGKFEEHFP